MFKKFIYFKAFPRIILAFLIDKLILRKPVSVLTYHSVGDNGEFFTVSLREFKWQMEYLYKNAYNVISLGSLINLIESGQVIPNKTVVITFDDGYEDNYTNVFKVLKKYKFPATIFLTTDWVGDKKHKTKRGFSIPLVDWDQVVEMHQSGLIDFEPHTLSHPDLTKLDINKAKFEINESRLVIEGKLRKKCYSFCYPYGAYSPDLESVVKTMFKASLSVRSGFIKNEDGLFLIKRNSLNYLTTKPVFRLKV